VLVVRSQPKALRAISLGHDPEILMKKPLSVGLVALGLVILVIFIGADALGIGEGTAIGWKQITGAVVGILIAGAGLFGLRRQHG
jgi:hypothetical protein